MRTVAVARGTDRAQSGDPLALRVERLTDAVQFEQRHSSRYGRCSRTFKKN
jgi:hypothetical protein